MLAPLFAEAVGVDADAQMLAEAEHRAVAAGSENVRWVHMRAEELPARLGSFQAVTFAQSFHWMERPRVATAVRSMLAPGGVWIHVNATTHRGIGAAPGDVPSPPHDEIEELVARFLGPVRRAGRAWLPDGTVEGEEEVVIAAGYSLRARLVVPSKIVAGPPTTSSPRSTRAPRPRRISSGDRLGEFEQELRALLGRVAADGRFRERMREIEIVCWEPGPPPLRTFDAIA